MREYLLVALVAAAVTFTFSIAARQLALRIGAVAKVRDRDIHEHETAYLGGLAMLAGLTAGFWLAFHLPFLGGHQMVTYDAQAIGYAAIVICLVGVIDDIIELPFLTKIAGQVLAAGIAVIGGVRIYWISLPGSSVVALDLPSSILFTVVVIFVVVNAINLIDGLDGLAVGVVGIGATAMFLYTYHLAYENHIVLATTASLVSVTIAGICLGFLPHNFHPARMFMGDSGSMLLGLLVSTSAISFTGQLDISLITTEAKALPAWLPILLPVAVVFIPLLDLILAYARRTLAGRWWFVADKQHLHHRLLKRGHSHIGAVALMYAWTAVLSFGVMFVGLDPRIEKILVFTAFTAAAAFFTWKPIKHPLGQIKDLNEVAEADNSGQDSAVLADRNTASQQAK